MLVLKFSTASILSRITKSSPIPIVNAYCSVYRAASLLNTPAGVEKAYTRKSGYLGRNLAPNKIATVNWIKTNLFLVKIMSLSINHL